MLVSLAALALAHPDTPGVVLLDVGRDEVEVELRLPADMLRAAVTGQPRPDLRQPPPPDAEVFSYIHEHLALVAGGEALSLTDEEVVWVTLDGEPFARVELLAHSERPIGDLTLHDAVISESFPPHQSTVTLRSDVAAPEARPRLVGWVRGSKPDLTIPIEGVHDPVAVAVETTWDGVHHVLSGADHLLFLLELLLVVPLVSTERRWAAVDHVPARRLVGLLSMFTVAHSLTLIAATLGWIPAPGRWVEVGVALTVLLAAVHLARPLWPGREGWFVAFAGLVHGSAFAEDMVGSGLSGWQLAIPLASFNVGIELGQLTIALLAVPLWWGARRSAAARWVVAGVAFVAAGAWLLERLVGWSSPLPIDRLLTTWWVVWPLLWGTGIWAWRRAVEGPASPPRAISPPPPSSSA